MKSIIAVVGGKKVGKTTTAENLILELTKRNYEVAAIKHVGEEDFTIDTPGKDTYRFAKNGAKRIIVMGQNEIATIEKGSTKKIQLEELLLRSKESDIIIIEGFKKAVSKRQDILKIVIVTSEEEALSATKNFDPIIAFSGPYKPEKNFNGIPYVNALNNPGKLVDIIIYKTKRI